MVVSIWRSCLQQCVLGCQDQGQPLPPDVPRDLPVGQLQLAEVVEMLQVCLAAFPYTDGGLAAAAAAATCH